MDGSQNIASYRDLLVWQKLMDLAAAAYDLTKSFPREEQFGLTSQIRRGAASVAANIAEGYGRESAGAYVQFLRTAQGSLKELETHLILSERVSLMEKQNADVLLQQTDEVGRMLRSLIRAVLNSSGGDR